MTDSNAQASGRFRWLWLEFMVIMLGVLTALFVDTWLKDYEDEQRGEIYRELLIKDLQTDIHTACNKDVTDIVFGRTGELPVEAGVTSSQADCNLDTAKYEIADAARLLRSHPDIPLTLRYRMSQARVAIMLFEAQITEAKKLLDQLRAS